MGLKYACLAKHGSNLIPLKQNIGGLALAYWIEYFASLNPNEAMAWRTPLALQLVFILIIGVGINFFPESPRWLMKMGRYEEARDILQATRSGDIEPEAKQIEQTVQHELRVASANQYVSMIFPHDQYTRSLRWRVFLAVWLQIMQELVGIGVVTVYAVDLFSTAGFSQNLSKLLAGFNNISYMFSVFFAVVTLDRYGRRREYRAALMLENCTNFLQRQWSGEQLPWALLCLLVVSWTCMHSRVGQIKDSSEPPSQP